MRKSSSYRWVILAMTFLPCFWMAVCQFQATAYAADLMETLSLSDAQYSTIATAPMLVGFFISLLAGALGDRLGVKKTVFLSLCITSAGAVLRAAAGSYPVLLTVTVLMGFAGVVINSNNTKLMNAWFSPEELALAIGIVIAAGNGGTIFAMLIGKRLSPSAAKAFLYAGIVFAVITLLWGLLVREQNCDRQAASEAPQVNIAEVLKSKGVWIAAIGAAFYMGVNLSVSALLSPGLVARGVSDEAAGLSVVVFALVALLSSVVMPGIIIKQKQTGVFCAVLSVAAGTALYLAWLSESAAARNVLLALTGICAGGLLPTLMSIPAVLPEIGPAKMGAAGGVISTIMMGGAFVLPSFVITGIAGGINNTAFLIAGLCAAVVAAAFLLLPNMSVRQE